MLLLSLLFDLLSLLLRAIFNGDVMSILLEFGQDKSSLILGKAENGKGELKLVRDTLVLFGAEVECLVKATDPLCVAKVELLANNVVVGLRSRLSSGSFSSSLRGSFSVLEGVLLRMGRVH